MLFPGVLRGIAGFLFTPVTSARTWFTESSASVPLYLRTQSALISDIRSLERQLDGRAADAFMLDLLTKENRALAEQLGVSDRARITASVLSGPSQTPYDTFLIDRGRDDGIVQGAQVYVFERLAIGRVVAVHAQSALVQLVSAPGVRAAAYVLGPDIFTEAEGMGGGIMRILVPQGVPLAEGDAVMLPAAGAGVYGVVTHIEALESSPNQYGYVSGPVPLRSIRFVQVGDPAPEQMSYERALEVVEALRQEYFQVEIPDAVLVGTSTPNDADDADEERSQSEDARVE